jgi:hypothetical protein
MEAIQEFFSRLVEQLFGRVSGPLNFRLFVMPTVVTILALRADRKDAREGRPAFLGAFIMDPLERRRIFRGGLTDIGRVFLMAVVLDTVYQLLVFRWVYPGQVLIVAFVCAVVPYLLVRGPIARGVRLLLRKRAVRIGLRTGPPDDGGPHPTTTSGPERDHRVEREKAS